VSGGTSGRGVVPGHRYSRIHHPTRVRLLAYLLEAEPVSIFASEARFNDASVLVEYDNGSRATILSSSHGSLAQPKDHLQAVLDRGAVEMVDFVECRTFGLTGFPEVQRFAGRPYDDCNNRHVSAFAQRGVEAMLEMRGRYFRAPRDAGVLYLYSYASPS